MKKQDKRFKFYFNESDPTKFNNSRLARNSVISKKKKKRKEAKKQYYLHDFSTMELTNLLLYRQKLKPPRTH